jgi:hypothetical protein
MQKTQQQRIKNELMAHYTVSDVIIVAAWRWAAHRPQIPEISGRNRYVVIKIIDAHRLEMLDGEREAGAAGRRRKKSGLP